MEKLNIAPLGTYQHYKNQKFYEVIGNARHSETLEELVIYKQLHDSEKFSNQQLWARPASMFLEELLHNGKMVRRFKLVSSK